MSWSRSLIRLGAGVIIFGLGLAASPIIFPAVTVFRTDSDVVRFSLITIGILAFGSITVLSGFVVTVVRRRTFRNQCPGCRYPVEPQDDVCPECSTRLEVDLRSHFIALSKAARDPDGTCEHCGSMVRTNLVLMNKSSDGVPGQVRCDYCGSPAAS